MVTAEHGNSEYVTIWVWLVVLLVLGLAIMALPIPKVIVVAMVFAVAVVKAAMVVRNYMHLKSEHMLIIAIVMVPVIFFFGFLITLIPDIAMRP